MKVFQILVNNIKAQSQLKDFKTRVYPAIKSVRMDLLNSKDFIIFEVLKTDTLGIFKSWEDEPMKDTQIAINSSLSDNTIIADTIDILHKRA